MIVIDGTGCLSERFQAGLDTSRSSRSIKSKG